MLPAEVEKPEAALSELGCKGYEEIEKEHFKAFGPEAGPTPHRQCVP